MFQSYAVNDCHNELFQIKSRRVCVIGGRRQKEKKDNNYPDIFKHFEIQTVFNINKQTNQKLVFHEITFIKLSQHEVFI